MPDMLSCRIQPLTGIMRTIRPDFVSQSLCLCMHHALTNTSTSDVRNMQGTPCTKVSANPETRTKHNMPHTHTIRCRPEYAHVHVCMSFPSDAQAACGVQALVTHAAGIEPLPAPNFFLVPYRFNVLPFPQPEPPNATFPSLAPAALRSSVPVVRKTTPLHLFRRSSGSCCSAAAGVLPLLVGGVRALVAGAGAGQLADGVRRSPLFLILSLRPSIIPWVRSYRFSIYHVFWLCRKNHLSSPSISTLITWNSQHPGLCWRTASQAIALFTPS